MRCPICGSKIIYEAIDHKHFSGGKAVAGAVLFGVVGAAAGFVGKDKKGYKCGACGAFSENTMDMNTEFAVNKAVRTAEDDGDFTSYNLYKKTYPNIEAVNSEQKRNNHSTKVEAALENDASDSISKNIYKNTKYDVKCPVFVEEVIIKTVNGSDVLSLLAWNHSDKTLRSVYFEIKILDDVGDLINETKCVYQGLAISPGEKLPLETEFALNTNIAYKVDFRCTKAAFNDDTVWRDSGQDYKELVIPTMLQPEDFPKYKAFKQKFCEKTSLNEDVDVYQPVFAEEYTQCICGFPFEINSKCAHCGLNVEDIANIISFENLVEFERQNIIKIAESRFNAVKSIFEKSKDGALEQAKSLMPADDNDDYEYAIICYEEALEALAKIPGWKNADELAKICNDRIKEIKAAQEAKRLETERLAEVERQESEKKAKRNKKIAIIVTPIVCAIIAFIIVLNTLIIPNSNYNDAIELVESGNYDEAIAIFESLNGYRDSATKIIESKTAIMDSIYNDAIVLMASGNYEEAVVVFETLNGYKDSVVKISECIEAINTIKFNHNIETIRTSKIGDCVFFGSYEQDNNIDNGKEDIEWIVLDIKDGRVLVISKCVLDMEPYHVGDETTWEKCNLRRWLNDDFLNNALSDDEKSVVPTTTVSADKNPDCDSDPGNATQDKLFLLSANEVLKYLASTDEIYGKPTDYVKAGALVYTDGTVSWLLRTAGRNNNCVAQVHGSWMDFMGSAAFYSNGVRPAMWITIGE